jgi:hypothetical protein
VSEPDTSRTCVAMSMRTATEPVGRRTCA